MVSPEIFSSETEFRVAKGLVYIEERIVVLRRDGRTEVFPFRIDLPGGGREGNETPFETFQRELAEELSISITEEDVQFSHKYLTSDDSETESYFIVVKPKGVSSETLILGSEGLEYVLITPEEFTTLSDGIPAQQVVVAKYLSASF